MAKHPSGFWVICEGCTLERFWETREGKRLVDDPCPRCRGRCYKRFSARGKAIAVSDATVPPDKTDAI